MFQFRLALRSLLKTPLVSAVAVLSLALGLGANAAIFSIFERVLLQSLEVPEPQRLVNVLSPGPKPGSQSTNGSGDMDSVFSYPMFRDLQEQQTSFEGIAAHRIFGANLAFAGNTISGVGSLVSGSYFEVLRLQPTLGRLFSAADDVTPGAHPLVVLGYRYWRTRFDASDSVINDTLIINGRPMTIVGVAPREFDGTTLGVVPQVYVPITMRDAMMPTWEGFDSRASYWAYLFARLRPGVSLEEAQAALNVPYRALIQEVELPLQRGMSDASLERFGAKEIVLEAGRTGQSNMQGSSGPTLRLLLGVTGFVLLIACANIANLLLTKAANRDSEIAVRLSIGAQRRHLVSQLLAESFLLALFGGLLGLVVALSTLRLIVSLLPQDGAEALQLGLGPATWIFLVVLTLLTGLVGLFPALHSTRSNLVHSLKNRSGQSSRSPGADRFRTAMAVLQIALSMTLLVAAGLFTRSLYNVSRVDLGIEIERLATFGLSPELNGYSPTESRALFERVEQEVAALPGVAQVAASMVPLIAGSNWGSSVSVQGFETTPDTDTHSNFNEIGPGYFRTLGVALISGREFELFDALEAPEVAIVNEAFARKFALGRDAVGKRMAVSSGTQDLDIEIVGLVPDTKYSEVKREVPPLFFLPYRQDEDLGAINFYVRSDSDPEQLLPTLRGVVARVDPNLPIENLRTMELVVRENVFLDRFVTTLAAAFAILATILAAIGLYGVVAYGVARKTREYGLRAALGADAARVRGLVLRHVTAMTVPGAVVGLLVAIGLGRFSSSLLFELEGHDPAVLAAAVGLLAVVALAAGLGPAQRASRVDPMTVLRDD